MNWEQIKDLVVTAVRSKAAKTIEEAFEVMVPEAKVAIDITNSIIDGAANGVDSAVDMKKVIEETGGVSADELKAYADKYEIAYAKLNEDIDAKLAQLPPETEEHN